MKKYYLKALKEEELLKIYDNNSSLQKLVFSDFLEEQQFFQSEDYEQVFDKGIKYHDYYDSFYLTIENYNEFLDTTDFYFYDDSVFQKNRVNEVEFLRKKIENLENKAYYETGDSVYSSKLEKKCDKLTKIFEKKCETLLKDLENQLHLYEDWNDNDVIDYFVDVWLENNQDYYIKNKTDLKVYRIYEECYV